MSWESKTEYCGLSEADKILVKSASENLTAQYLEKHGANGAYAATKVFGERRKPSNAYTVKATAVLSGKFLGNVTNVNGTPFALESIKCSTGADQEPSLEATAAEIESGGATANKFAVPEFEISPDHVAQIPKFKFGSETTYTAAFSIAGTSCEVTNADLEISCSVKTNDKNGAPQAHDVTNGHVVVNATVMQYGTTEPTLTAATGWDISSPLTCDDPDAEFPSWKATLSRPLAKTIPA